MRRSEHPPQTFTPTESPMDLTQNNRTQLLVSVRSVEELQLAVEAGVAWVDLKNPDSGS
ncbi:MAG: (5-formylfuran-3-yl)methyl phosphate synthase, partial [Pirellulaceae bacterium]